MTESASTRDKIIDAAFSFYRKPVFTNISLSQIAQKVGISKAAIFKHFSNKEALGQALFERMFDGIAEAIRRMIECYKNGKRIEAMSEAIDFLINIRFGLLEAFYRFVSRCRYTPDLSTRSRLVFCSRRYDVYPLPEARFFGQAYVCRIEKNIRDDGIGNRSSAVRCFGCG